VGSYRIVPDESVAWIEARSSLHPIHSENRGLEGFVELEVLPGPAVDLGAPLGGRVELPLDRLSSGNPLYDREMRRRVDARRYPMISGELTAMSETGRENRYLVQGEVTLRGTTRRYEDEMTLSGLRKGVICLEGEHVFDIRDFGMEPPKIMMLRVYPEVRVRVRVVAQEEG